jgi:hypothetical protein
VKQESEGREGQEGARPVERARRSPFYHSLLVSVVVALHSHSKMKSFLALAALVPFAAAHFTLDYPTSRGFDEDLEPSELKSSIAELRHS